MSDDKYIVLLKRLWDQARNGELNWKVLGDSDDEYFCSFARFSLSIHKYHDPNPNFSYQDPEDLYSYSIRLRDEQGRIIDEMSSVKLLDFYTPTGDGILGTNTPWFIMKSIFETARRNALGADKAIDEILRELEK